MGHSEQYENRTNNYIRLGAFFFNHDSEIVFADRRRSISLVNVTHEGARLRKHDGVDYALGVGSPITLNLKLGDEETERLSGTVAWATGTEVFVDFGRRLSVGVGYLQGLADN